MEAALLTFAFICFFSASVDFLLRFLTFCSAYMEQTGYPAHYGALPDRSAPVFGADSQEPRAPRPFEPTHASNDPYGAAAVATHPQPAAMTEGHSPMSSEYPLIPTDQHRNLPERAILAFVADLPDQ